MVHKRHSEKGPGLALHNHVAVDLRFESFAIFSGECQKVETVAEFHRRIAAARLCI